jgi:hypothetical protein
VYVLRIQHPVMDFDRWKAAFDADPLDRTASGVRAYSVRRGVDEPLLAAIDLEFDDLEAAVTMRGRLEAMWSQAPGGISAPPDTWLLETVDIAAGG